MWESFKAKMKSFGSKLIVVLEDIGKRRAEKALQYELYNYYRTEYGYNHMKEIGFPKLRHDRSA